jgi:hypothetical protein
VSRQQPVRPGEISGLIAWVLPVAENSDEGGADDADVGVR